MTLSARKLIDTTKLPFRPYFLTALVINLVVVTITFIVQPFLPPEVPLFYGMAEGEGQLIRAIFLFLPNALALTILVANLIISSGVKEEFYKKMLVIAGIIATSFATVTTLKIILLVGSF